MKSDDTRTRRSGFSLLEMIMVLLLLAVAIVPLINAFSPAIASQAAEEGYLVFHNRARGTLARVLTIPFPVLSANQSSSVNLVALFRSEEEAARESFEFRGANWQPQVAITSGGTGGLLRVSVSLEDVTLHALKADY